MKKPLTIECKIHFNAEGKGARKTVQTGPAPKEYEAGRVPRVSRLLALALKFDRLIREGKLDNYARLAELGAITRARASQVMGLVNLAPDIIEALLHLPRTLRGRDSLKLADLLPLTQILDWNQQRRRWRQFLQS